ncbi:2-hydroxy-3-oxopropionate reductase [Propioniciclava soli]|uniref:2-hydroxy-3-oxopropionate reductase n=1 Tax=Propioniciclava soli TaxID=2775081 RepID=UPI002FCD0CCB
MKVGFIGLGIMGRPMALNLIEAGHELVVLGGRTGSDALADAGASTRATPRAVAEAVEVLITMLPNSPDVEEVVLGENGVIEGAHDGLVVVDASSIAPASARAVHDALAERGVAMLDAPVSGGEPKAVDGTLAFMVGGDAAVFEAVTPLLEVMGASVTHVGAIGAGNITKLANQAIVAVNIAVAAEAMTLAARSGVDPQAVYAAIRGGLAGSTVLDAKVPLMLERRFDPGFRIALHIKDLDNVLVAGHAAASPLPLTAAVREMMTTLAAGGHAGEDHSALLRHYEKLTGEAW